MAPPGWHPGGVVGRLLNHRMIAGQLTAAGAAIRPGRRAIDVGAGAGARSRVLSQAGMHVIALEPDAREAARLRASLGRRIDVIEAPLVPGTLPRDQADLVLAWHVLEHLPDVDAALAEMAGALAPGGRLVLAVPNAASLESRLFGGRWHGWEPARHRWHFRAHVLRRLLAGVGLDAIDVRVAGGWAMPTSLAYSLAPRLDHQLHPGHRGWSLGLVAAVAPFAAAARLARHGSQLVAVATFSAPVAEPDAARCDVARR